MLGSWSSWLHFWNRGFKRLFHICYGPSSSIAIFRPLQNVIHNICWRWRIRSLKGSLFYSVSPKVENEQTKNLWKGDLADGLKCDISNEKPFKWCLNVLWLWPQCNVCSSQPSYQNWQQLTNCFQTSKVNTGSNMGGGGGGGAHCIAFWRCFEYNQQQND